MWLLKAINKHLKPYSIEIIISIQNSFTLHIMANFGNNQIFGDGLHGCYVWQIYEFITWNQDI
jgi:hypothetical protein